MSTPDGPSTKNQALVAALQWGLVQLFVLDTLGRLLQNYYRATTDAFFPPDWVASIQFAAPLGLLVGGIGGYRWVTSGQLATSASAHRKRVVFVGSLLAGWTLAIVPTLAFQWFLGDQLFSIPYFVLPTLTAVAVFVGSHLLAYRVDSESYRRHRTRLLGAVKGAFAGLMIGMIGFVAYAGYLAATRTTYSLSGGPGIVVVVGLSAIAGYVLTDTERSGDRSAEFIVLLILFVLAFSLVTTLSMVVLKVVGVPLLGLASSFVWPLIPLVLALTAAGYLTYGVQTTFYRRFVGR
ncbi:hypothetical protein [Halopelagius longus]|uniref:Uncharacterized protein n=1 Tax=Halopelagius longus TaxID=1236180 RepID=A0A1H1FQB2_9EURY|nr:hypothetical protein [Halopelagius longus]RDI69992.1 hypothetical protein DWB78_15270 [Halopelagius longus]SDR02909.1 hypothetical protein SAMN05216278_3338 [Halopelagius longus]